MIIQCYSFVTTFNQPYYRNTFSVQRTLNDQQQPCIMLLPHVWHNKSMIQYFAKLEASSDIESISMIQYCQRPISHPHLVRQSHQSCRSNPSDQSKSIRSIKSIKSINESFSIRQSKWLWQLHVNQFNELNESCSSIDTKARAQVKCFSQHFQERKLGTSVKELVDDRSTIYQSIDMSFDRLNLSS